MRIDSDVRAGELVGDWPQQIDASLCFVGRIATPWRTRSGCPKRGDLGGPVCRVEIFAPWRPALEGIERHLQLQILYWMHLARRDLVRQRPHGAGTTVGTFSVRSPVRPNPIAVSRVALVGIEEGVLSVRGLDCVDGTPLVDVKPEYCPVGTEVDLL